MRYEKLDVFRGIAIILMVLFHLNYSLLHIFEVYILNFSSIIWWGIGRVAAILFIFIAGISFFLAEQKYGDNLIKKYLKVSFVLGLLAIAISISTFTWFPELYIAFGIIHFFALSFLLLLCFRIFKYYNILWACLIIIYGFYYIPMIQSEYFYFLGFTYSGFYSADFYPIFPYFGIILFGYSFALFLSNTQRLDLLTIASKKNFIISFLSLCGKKSLLIYIIHQPIIIFILYILLETKLIIF